MLLGRAAEVTQLESMLASARAGLSSALTLRGEAGVGKSALLDHAVELAAGMQIARVAGVESEMSIGFATLHRLLVPFIEARETLPAPQRDALGAAFGLIAGVPPDRFLVGLAVLTLLADAATEQPLLCIVDDAQWIDQESLEVVAFVGRRLLAERIVLLFAVRDPGERIVSLKGLAELRLAGLHDEHARALLTTVVRGPLDHRVANTIVAESAGNPLAIVELANELSPAQLSGGQMLPDPLPLGSGLEERFVRQVRTLSADVQTLLLVAAADPSGEPALVAQASATLGVVADLGDARVKSGRLLEIDHRVRFRHPLIRAAVYGAASPEQRRSVHHALAASTDRDRDPDRRAWHLAEASIGPDEAVAIELETSADRARVRGGYTAEAAFLARAAEMSADHPDRARRYVAAAGATVNAGAPDRADLYLSVADVELLSPALKAEALRLQGVMKVSIGRPAQGVPLLVGAAEAFRASNPRMARETFLEALVASLIARDRGTGLSAGDVARAGLDAPRPTSGEARFVDLALDGFALRFGVGYDAAVEKMKQVAAILHTPQVAVGDPTRWFLPGLVTAREVWNHEALYVWLHRAEVEAREQGALQALRLAVSTLATINVMFGRFDAAEANIAELRELTTAIAAEVDFFQPQNIELLAWQGREDECRSAAAVIMRGVGDQERAGSQVNMARIALVVLDLGLGRYQDACITGRRVFVDDPPYHGAQVLPDLIEAAMRSGDIITARATLQRLSDRTVASDTPWARGALARSLALVGTAEDASRTEAHYLEALVELEQTPIATEIARTHLVYGEWLRRQNRRVDARVQLEAAHEMFATMGANAFGERARAELLATGARATQANARDTGRPHAAGSTGRAACVYWSDQSRDRRAALHQPEHRRVSPEQDLPKALGDVTPPTRSTAKCRRPETRRPRRPVGHGRVTHRCGGRNGESAPAISRLAARLYRRQQRPSRSGRDPSVSGRGSSRLPTTGQSRRPPPTRAGRA